MTTVTVTLSHVCSGGNHLVFDTSGDKVVTIPAMLEDVTSPIEDSDLVSFVKVLAKMAKSGRTVAQAKALLQAGVTVTI